MKYYINPIWFYLMNVSTGMKVLMCVFGGAVLVFSALGLTVYVYDECTSITDLDNDEKKIVKIFKKIIIASFMILLLGILVPSKETCIEMMIASQVTHENVTATKEEIYGIIDYVTDKVKGEEEK